MFSFAVLALAAASASAHSISHVRRHHVPRAQPPAGWATSHLEGYDAYHARYQAIGCGNKHNTTFFDLCCHPLLATETVKKNRPACCAVGATAACPGTAPHSAAAPAKSSAKTPAAPAKTPAKTTVAPAKTPAKTTVAPAKTPATTTAAPAAPAKTTAAQDDGDEDCDDEDDDNDTTDDGDYDDEDDGEDCDDEDEGESTTHAAPTSTKAAPTTSSHTAAPPATSTHTTPKETTTTQAPTTHTTPKSTPVPTTSASTGGKSSSGGFTTGGFGTWFTQNGVAGACGKVHKDSEFVVALQTKTYANGANCGRKIQLCDMTTNKCVNGVVADECPTCTNPESVDMSEAMFEALAALSVGEFKIQWKFIGS